MTAYFGAGKRSRAQMDKAAVRNNGPVDSFDMLCIGLGAASLAIAVNLAEQKDSINALFLDRRKRFTWAPATVLADAHVPNSFLHDLVSTRNPRSRYTFLNFLRATDQLLPFTNASKMEPTRLQMEQYFQWVAGHFERLGWTRHGQEVVNVTPLRRKRNSQQISEWRVTVKQIGSGEVSVFQTKRLIISNGATPYLPSFLRGSEIQSFVSHSNESENVLGNLERPHNQLNIAVIGADQEAGEIFARLHSNSEKLRATLFVADSSLRPEDETAFTQDLVDNNGSSRFPPEIRQRRTVSDLHTPKISLPVLERLYELQYMQKLTHPKASDQPFRISFSTEVTGAELVPAASDRQRVRLSTRPSRTLPAAEESSNNRSTEDFDLVVAATGYTFDSSIAHFPGLEEATVDKEYLVNLGKNELAPGCGIWLLDKLQDPGRRQDDVRWLAERADRVVGSIRRRIEEERRLKTAEENALL